MPRPALRRVLAVATTAVLGASIALSAPTPAHATLPDRADLIGVRNDGTLWIYPNTGSATAPYSGRVQIGQGWAGFKSVVGEDFNGDGRTDILAMTGAGTPGAYTASVYPNNFAASNATSQFSSPVPATVSPPNTPRLVAAGDLNGDRRADLLVVQADGKLAYQPNVVHSQTFTGSRYEFNSGFSMVGQGWGAFTEIRLADMNGDGLADIVARHSDGRLLLYPHVGMTGWEWLTNSYRGGGMFGAPIQIGHGWAAFKTIALGDLNGDGWPDLVGIHNDGRLLRYLNAQSTTAPFSSGVQIGQGWSGFTAIHLGNHHSPRQTSLSLAPNEFVAKTRSGISGPFPTNATTTQLSLAAYEMASTSTLQQTPQGITPRIANERLAQFINQNRGRNVRICATGTSGGVYSYFAESNGLVNNFSLPLTNGTACSTIRIASSMGTYPPYLQLEFGGSSKASTLRGVTLTVV